MVIKFHSTRILGIWPSIIVNVKVTDSIKIQNVAKIPQFISDHPENFCEYTIGTCAQSINIFYAIGLVLRDLNRGQIRPWKWRLLFMHWTISSNTSFWRFWKSTSQIYTNFVIMTSLDDVNSSFFQIFAWPSLLIDQIPKRFLAI